MISFGKCRPPYRPSRYARLVRSKSRQFFAPGEPSRSLIASSHQTHGGEGEGHHLVRYAFLGACMKPVLALFLRANIFWILEMSRAIMVASFIAIPLICSAQAPCDPELVQQTDPKDSDRYTQRETGRCEGVYLQNVSSTVGELLVASLTANEQPQRWFGGGLVLRWNQFSRTDVHIQAFPLVPRKHYRLDVQTGAVTSYEWNTTLVEKYLTPDQTGLVAWTTTTIDGRNQRVYLPIAVGEPGAPIAPYRLALVPPVELSEVYLTVTSIQSGDKPLRLHTPLNFGYYPANHKIVVDLPSLPKPGLYRIELIGDRKDRGSVATPPLLINHVQ
jgi:hypothetical protein